MSSVPIDFGANHKKACYDNSHIPGSVRHKVDMSSFPHKLLGLVTPLDATGLWGMNTAFSRTCWVSDNRAYDRICSTESPNLSPGLYEQDLTLVP